jgi:hypothetical protein
MAMPGRAQQGTSGRFAFADTTLLRDTLGLTFDRLFILADSLSLTPDTLRALSVRYRYSLSRLLHLADSLGMTVDSVGVAMLRERYNPLGAIGPRSNTFTYSSGYSIQQTTSSWTNGADYGLTSGPVFLRNTTSVGMDRYQAGGRLSLQQRRSSVTETGWKFSPNFSMGGRANLERFLNLDPNQASNEGETKNEYQLSMRGRQQPLDGLSTQFNFFGGLLDLKNSSQRKRGLSGDLSGRMRLTRGAWFTHDGTGQLTGNIARTRLPLEELSTQTRDLSSNVRGTLGVLSNRPIGLNVNYGLRNTKVEAPGDSGRIQRVRSSNNSVEASLRMRQGSERTLNVAQRFAENAQATAGSLTNQSTRDENGFVVNGRFGYGSWSLEGNFNRSRSTSTYPRRSLTGGYQEKQDNRAIDGTLTWSVTPRLNVKATGNVSLVSSRYSTIGTFPSPPVPKDQYAQSYRIEGLYTRSIRSNTAIALEVDRSLFVNLPAASTAANTETRSYRAEWRWSYRLFQGLTATQRNQLLADYVYYTFLPASNDRLSLDYGTLTTLNAVITRRLQLDVTHNTRFQPSGNYWPLDPPIDGSEYFQRADDSETRSLRARLSYTPAPSISINIEPIYLGSDRHTTSNGVSVPQRTSRSLNFSGGTSLNFPVGARGRLTGDIRRTFNAARTTNYVHGIAVPTPAAEQDYWVGSLQLSWDLQ